jgi:mevalonate kinase
MAIAPGKLLLFGEHAAVQGYPAVGIPLPLGVSFVETPWMGEAFPGIPDQYHQALKNMIALIAGPQDPFGSLREKPSLKIDSQLPLGAGFGSSGALSTAVARYYHPQADPQSIWDLANRGESIFHGSPSGIDTGLSVYERGLGFHFHGGVLPRVQDLPTRNIPLVVSAVPRKKDTYTYVSQVKALCEGSPRAQAQLQALGELSERLLDPEPLGAQELGLLTQQAQSILSDWGLVPDSLSQLIQGAKDFGSTGGKVSGAGGGGAFFLVPESPEAADKLISYLKGQSHSQDLPLLLPPFLVKF